MKSLSYSEDEAHSCAEVSKISHEKYTAIIVENVDRNGFDRQSIRILQAVKQITKSNLRQNLIFPGWICGSGTR